LEKKHFAFSRTDPTGGIFVVNRKSDKDVLASTAVRG
jgi:hypothetical protein